MIDPWQVDPTAFPRHGSSSEQLRFLLNYAVLAPSSHNTQPWLFRIADDTVKLFADRTRALPVVDPEDRALLISCGAALYNLRIAIRHFGLSDEVQLLPDPTQPDLLARASLGTARPPSPDESQQFSAIPFRRSNRLPFEARPLPNTLIDRLVAAAVHESAWLAEVEGEGKRNAVADLIAEGDRIQAASKPFRRELAAWIHHNRSRSRDGMPGYAHGIGDLASLVGPFIIRTFNWGNGQAAKDRQLAVESPLLAVLGTATDDLRAWLATGQALSSVLLCARRGRVRVVPEPTDRGAGITSPACRVDRAQRLPTDIAPARICSRGATDPPTPRGRGVDRLGYRIETCVLGNEGV